MYVEVTIIKLGYDDHLYERYYTEGNNYWTDYKIQTLLWYYQDSINNNYYFAIEISIKYYNTNRNLIKTIYKFITK